MGAHTRTIARLTGVLLALGATTAMTAGSFQVELRAPGWVDLTVTQAEQLREGALQLVESAALNTVDDAAVLRQTSADLRRRFQAAISGPHMVVTLGEPQGIQSLDNGLTQVVQILVGLDRPVRTPGSVFTVDNRGQLCAHESYSERLLAELFELAGAITVKNAGRSYTF